MGVCGCGKSTVAETLCATYRRHADRSRRLPSAGERREDERRHAVEPTKTAPAGWPRWPTGSPRVRPGVRRWFVTCSALKLAYRDRLRQGDPDLFFVFLDGSRELLQARMDARKGHFMPPGLLGSQLRHAGASESRQREVPTRQHQPYARADLRDRGGGDASLRLKSRRPACAGLRRRSREDLFLPDDLGRAR